MMGKGSDFNAGAAFNESLQKRIEGYERSAERSKKRWNSARTAGKIAGSTDFVDIPDFKLQRHFDKDTGKVSYEIAQGTRRIKTPHLNGIKRLKRRAYYEASGYIHRKIAENEEDNDGLKAAHKLEQAGEEGIADLKRALPSGRTLMRKAQRSLEQRAKKAERDYNNSLFQKEMAEDQLKKSGNTFTKEIAQACGKETAKQSGDMVMKDSGMVLSKEAGVTGAKATKKAAEKAVKEAGRQAQKRMMRYAAMQAEAMKKGTETAAAVKGAEGAAVAGATTAGAATTTTASMATGVGEYVLIGVAIIVLIILIIIAIIMLIIFFLSIQFFQTNVAGGIYQSEPMEIEAAELHYSYMEASLSAYIEEIEDREEGYDGYVFDSVDAIGHNPYTLINYLSAVYEDFTFNDVKDEVEDLFNTSYTLTTWVEDIEVTPPEPEEDEETEEDEEEEDEEEEEPETITLHILHVKLTRKPLEEIVADRLSDEERETYDLYGETRGGFQFIKSPTGGDYSSNISSLYGYRYHPIYEEIRLHRGLDIALPEGTDLYAGIDGTVTTGDDPGGYGLYVIISGTDGTEVRYAHMSEIHVSTGDTVRKGDIIGLSGNTGASTGPHVHVEVIQNGEYYNPLFYLDTE